MKVGELISVLMSHDRDLDIMLKDYDGGYYVTSGVSERTFQLNVNSEEYYGPHEVVADNYVDERDKYDQAKGILIV